MVTVINQALPEREFQICLVGSGGVGTIAAVALEKSQRANVTVVLRSSYDIVKEKGWDIESIDHGSLKGWRPSRVVASIEEAAALPGAASESSKVQYDYVVCSTKQVPEKYSVAELLAPLITPSHTTIVLIQNGLNIHLPLIAAFPTNAVCSAVSMIGSFATGPNQISQIGHDILQIGPHYHAGLADELSLARTATFIELYRAWYTPGCTADCKLAPDMPLARWIKLLWNGSFNTVCALMKFNVGEVIRSGAMTTLIVPIMREIASVANADGHPIADDVVESMSAWSSATSVYRPSMLLDREQGRPMEFEVILGHAIVRADELGVAVPIMTTVYEMLKLVRWQKDNK